jgi:hypothetical protein
MPVKVARISGSAFEFFLVLLGQTGEDDLLVGLPVIADYHSSGPVGGAAPLGRAIHRYFAAGRAGLN